MDFAWWPDKASKTVASYRIRCLQIIEELSRRSVSCGRYEPGDAPPKALVLQKRYDPDSVAHAVELRAKHGARIALDLCDNYFSIPGEDVHWRARSETLTRAVEAADLVTSATETLAEMIHEACPHAKKVVVIGDAVEQPHAPSLVERTSDPAAELHLWSLQRALASTPRRRLVWYGAHGADSAQAGMIDLQRVYPLLETLDREIPLQLTVISNRLAKYRDLVRDWRIETHYLRWRPTTFSRAMRLHEICLLPITDNPFTRCKTNNRVATSLLHDVPVVADSIPSYEPFAGAIVLNDWEGGLRLFLNDRVEAQGRIALGKQMLDRDWTLPQVADRWHATLRDLIDA